MKLIRNFILGTICSFMNLGIAIADKPIDKSAYTLSKPLPKKDWGDMRVDRPNITASPYIIDPGSHNFEMGLFAYTWNHDKHNGTNEKTRSYSVFAPTYRVGILYNLEFDATITAHTNTRTRDLTDGTRTRQHGFGDTVLQVKYNLWGNDGEGQTAFGLIPAIKIPTNEDDLGNHHVEGTLFVPLDIKITEKMSLGTMVAASYIRGNTHRKYVWSFPVSAALSFDCTEKLNNYVELFAEKSTESGSRWNVICGFGGCYAVTEDWMVDAGLNIGLSKAAADYAPYIGMSVRF